MKAFIILILAVASTSMAQAAKKDSKRCYDFGVSIAKKAPTENYIEATALSAGKLCITEKNVKSHDADDMISTGDFEITITSRDRKVATYKFGARSAEPGLAYDYETYGKEIKDVEEGSKAQDWEIISFQHSIVPESRGEIMGRATIFGTEVTLIGK